MNARFLGAALVALTLTSACGNEEAPPQTLPPVSVAPSPVVSAGPSVPPSAQAETPQGAAEFARFWFATLNTAAKSGNTAQLRSLGTAECTTCDAFADSIDNLYGGGGRIEGGVFTIQAAEAPALEPGVASARVTVIYDVSPTKQLGPDGKELRSTPALRAVDGDMRLTRVSGQWRVAGLATS